MTRPDVWSGSVVVRIAQVGQVGQVGQAGGQLVEPPQRAAERVRMREFQDAALRSAGLPDGERDRAAILFRDSLAVKYVPTDLLRIETRAYSRPEVSQLLTAVVGALRRQHDELAAPTIRNLSVQAAEVSAALAAAQSDLESMRRLEAGNLDRTGPKQFEASVFLQTAMAGRVKDIRELEVRNAMLSEQLSPVRTYSTTAVDAVRVDPRRASPHPARNGLAAILAGAAIAIVWILSADRLRAPAAAETAVPRAARPAATPARRGDESVPTKQPS
jgi:hypothetical protein